MRFNVILGWKRNLGLIEMDKFDHINWLITLFINPLSTAHWILVGFCQKQIQNRKKIGPIKSMAELDNQ
jgi:hypothetical protein